MRKDSFEQQQEQKRLYKAIAFELARQFCEKHGYAQEKLKTQRYVELPSCVCFSQPSGIKPDGLRNDIATQPLPTLVLKLKDGRIQIETTEHTRKYLGN